MFRWLGLNHKGRCTLEHLLEQVGVSVCPEEPQMDSKVIAAVVKVNKGSGSSSRLSRGPPEMQVTWGIAGINTVSNSRGEMSSSSSSTADRGTHHGLLSKSSIIIEVCHSPHHSSSSSTTTSSDMLHGIMASRHGSNSSNNSHLGAGREVVGASELWVLGVSPPLVEPGLAAALKGR
jgi:hypothetical protein